MTAQLTARRNQTLANEIDAVFPLSEPVRQAIAGTDREAFVPAGFKRHAFALNPLPIGGAQFISSPLTVAKMTQYLSSTGGDRVLEIGCGSGYQAAVLARLFRGVFTIERIESLAAEARSRFKAQGLHNVNVRVGDGQLGWPGYGPYECILFSASAAQIPRTIIDQLAEGGVLVAPMQRGNRQEIVRYVKTGDTLHEERLEACEFVPVLSGVQK